MYCISTERDNLVELMTKYKCKIDFKDRNRKAAIHYCCTHSENKCLQILIDNGADIDIQDEIGRSPLWHAASKDNRSHIIETLLENGCVVDLHDDREKRSPLQVAILHADEDRLPYVKTLLRAGADVNHIDAFLQSPLMTVIQKVASSRHKFSEIDVKIAKLLIEHGADVDYISEGETWFQLRGSALCFAATVNCVQLIQVFLDAGADPNLDGGKRLTQGVDDKIVTPLLLAAYHNYKDIARHLLLHGCNLGIVGQMKIDDSYQRMTPFKCALLRGNFEVAELLVMAGYKVQEEAYLFSDDGEIPETLLCNFQFYTWLFEFTKTSLPLMLQCRRFIHKCLGKGTVHKACQLELPPRLRDFILYKDIAKD